VQVIRTGDWAKARDVFRTMEVDVGQAGKRAILQEAHFLRQKMLQGIRDQAPGGKRFKPLSKLTLAARRLAGFRGTKALMVHGDLRNSINVHHGSAASAGAVFIGILRTARSSKGKSLINIAEVHEWGATVVLRVTPKMRRFLAVLMKEANRESGGGLGDAIPRPFWLIKAKGNRKPIIVIHIPPRPYVRPVFEVHARPAAVKARMEERMTKLLKGKLAK
jgi:hypothetical protein